VLTLAPISGVLRDVAVKATAAVECRDHADLRLPAMNMIALEIELALERAGIRGPKSAPCCRRWTTDWMSDDGRRNLGNTALRRRRPPVPAAHCSASSRVACPQCGSQNTELLSEFGSTSCKALWRCKSCREPFDYFKCH